ncbi:MAG TPA: thioesterase domain-containing protein [Gaiellaceae bacterium]|nr:thioesterase domain-containing protein [Gaiellaceae bacterium]
MRATGKTKDQSISFVRWADPERRAWILICFPWAGAGASPYYRWPAWVGDSGAVWALRLAGRETRFAEAPVANLGQLIPELVDELETQISSPYVLLGQCSGALLAFEVALELVRRGSPEPSHFIVAAEPAPSRTHLHAQRGVSDLREEVRTLGLMPADVLDDDDLFDLLESALQADLHLSETYEYCPDHQLACDLTAVVGREDQHVSRDELLGWREATTGAYSLREIDGDHLFSGKDHRGLALLVASVLSAE